MTGEELCPHCGKWFPTEIDIKAANAQEYGYYCDHCSLYVIVENLPRIVWKRCDYSDMYYTTLVHRYTKIDGYNYMKFEYFNLPGKT